MLLGRYASIQEIDPVIASDRPSRRSEQRDMAVVREPSALAFWIGTPRYIEATTLSALGIMIARREIPDKCPCWPRANAGYGV